jgi:hypothetical protein
MDGETPSEPAGEDACATPRLPFPTAKFQRAGVWAPPHWHTTHALMGMQAQKFNMLAPDLALPAEDTLFLWQDLQLS